MYQVKCDNFILYSPGMDELTVESPFLSLLINTAGTFTFRMEDRHPYYGRVQKLRSIIEVLQDGEVIFRGRVIETNENWLKARDFICEGDLAFLNDVIYEPFVHQGSPEQLFRDLITYYNAQADAVHQFVIGDVTVTDPNDYIYRSSEEYLPVLEVLKSRLLDSLGGYVRTRTEGGVTYIDYLETLDVLSNQPVTFGSNLLDLERYMSGVEMATAILPLGYDDPETGVRVTIESVNAGSKILRDEAAIAAYGYICKREVWDDVADPTNLKTKAAARLAQMVAFPTTWSIRAADLAPIYPAYNSFRLGRMVKVTSEPHGVDDYYMVEELSINLQDPSLNELTMGKTQTGLIEQNAQANTQLVERIDKVYTDVPGIAENAANNAITKVENRMESLVSQTAESIITNVTESYYLKGEMDQLLEQLQTQIIQNSEYIEFQFNTFQAELSDLENGTDARFFDISRYIRFDGGNIELGEVNSSFKQLMTNEKNAFLDSGVEVAYFSNQKMYVTAAEISTSLQIGKFAFVPRMNGNLSFKKVVN